MTEHFCKLCSGSGKIGNKITGLKTCPYCITDKNDFGTEMFGCPNCMGAGKSGDYITGFMPCSRCKGSGYLKKSG